LIRRIVDSALERVPPQIREVKPIRRVKPAKAADAKPKGRPAKRRSARSARPSHTRARR
jgi:hypothetical protein